MPSDTGFSRVRNLCCMWIGFLVFHPAFAIVCFVVGGVFSVGSLVWFYVPVPTPVELDSILSAVVKFFLGSLLWHLPCLTVLSGTWSMVCLSRYFVSLLFLCPGSDVLM